MGDGYGLSNSIGIDWCHQFTSWLIGTRDTYGIQYIICVFHTSRNTVRHNGTIIKSNARTYTSNHPSKTNGICNVHASRIASNLSNDNDRDSTRMDLEFIDKHSRFLVTESIDLICVGKRCNSGKKGKEDNYGQEAGGAMDYHGLESRNHRSKHTHTHTAQKRPCKPFSWTPVWGSGDYLNR